MVPGIVFANPPAEKREGQQKRGMFPLPLVALANVLNHRVTVEHVSPDLLPSYTLASDIINRSRADWVAITCYQETMPSAVTLAKIAKRAGKRVVVGGHHVTLWGGKAILDEIPEIDYAIIGEGELPIKLLVEGYAPQRIPNLWWRDHDVPTTNHLPEYQIAWRDSPPMIRGYTAFDYSHLWERMKRIGRSPYARPFSVIGVRGCAYANREHSRCSICAMPLGIRLRCRAPQHFWAEISWAVQHYGVDLVWEHSDSFLGIRPWLAKLAKIRPQGTPPIWCYGRADEIDESTIKSISKIGVEHIYIGVECGSDQRLRLVKKGITLARVLNAIRLCRHYNIRVQPSFIVGLPGETRWSIQDTIDFALQCRGAGADDVIFHEFILWKGLAWFTDLVALHSEFDRVVLDQGELQRLHWQHFNPHVKRAEALEMVREAIGVFPHSELTAWNT